MPDMRFAPPAALRLADHGGGLNQTSVRAYNERLVLSLLRRHETLSRQAITQMSGLSTQTVSVITNALEHDNLLMSGEPVRGKVGPPSRLLSLNPEGAYSIGIKIGIKSTELVLMDFAGNVLHHLEQQYQFPKISPVMNWVEQKLPELMKQLPADHRKRMVGIGVSLPANFEDWPLGEWDTNDKGAWADVNIEERLQEISGLSVYIQNDVTSAAGAEIIFGAARELDDFAYYFVGAATTGRLVLTHHIHAGRKSSQEIASLSSLEQVFAATGTDGAIIWTQHEDWPLNPSLIDEWAAECADGIINNFAALSAFVDLNTIIIDGRVPDAVRQIICHHITTKRENAPGLTHILPGKVGTFAKSIGAACLPFHSRFMVDDVGLAG